MKSQNRFREGQACPACGMERASWPSEGYILAGVEYCCQGCGEGSGCTCFHKSVGGATSKSSDTT